MEYNKLVSMLMSICTCIAEKLESILAVLIEEKIAVP